MKSGKILTIIKIALKIPPELFGNNTELGNQYQYTTFFVIPESVLGMILKFQTRKSGFGFSEPLIQSIPNGYDGF